MRRKFTEEEIEKANSHQELLDNANKTSKTYKGLNLEGNKMKYLSEAMFSDGLEFNGIPFKEENSFRVGGDEWDFTITIGDKDYRVDVKAQQPDYPTVCVDESKIIKANKYGAMFYFFVVDLKNNKGESLGWCYPDDMYWNGGHNNDGDKTFLFSRKKLKKLTELK